MRDKDPDKPRKLTDLVSPDAIHLLAASGSKLIETIGMDIVRGVVLDVLTGKNLRDSTEALTRKRIATLNLALLQMFLNETRGGAAFGDELLDFACKRLTAARIGKEERWLAQWVLGLTDKAFQNVLRDEPGAITAYTRQYQKTCHRIVEEFEHSHGPVAGSLAIQPGLKAEINTLFMVYLMNAVGSETLTIRGSEKSTYGKLFEKLVLGSLLSILGFRLVDPGNLESLNKVFWLSQQGERRESDATLLYAAGKGVRFDIGFIGRGNPEISLDKVTRFERQIELGHKRWYLATIIIVDRIGKSSRIEKLARRVGGSLVQMSMSYWPKDVARELEKVLGYSHEILRLSDKRLDSYLRRQVARVPMEKIVGLQG
ncbi:MAG TPA: CfrBI family restriction endonuclease [Phycisphaerales bacterium]|nr:CfrBI family restriction endonuclease [Phycisphaerales bacterium]